PGTKQTCEFDSSDEEPVEGERTPFHISWLDPSPVHYPQFLGLCSLPGCRFKDVGRNLQKDLGEPKSCGARDLFVFCTRGELARYRVPDLPDAYRRPGFAVHRHPFPDGDAPAVAGCRAILDELAACLDADRKTVIHCYGGLGRSCLVAACLLLRLSDTGAIQEVIDGLRNPRGSGAIQTRKVMGVRDFEKGETATDPGNEVTRPQSQ
uniref:Cyclin-dependent kinase inhibitor 3 n=1 Tax=Ornithorhynchus anatinus TaxID=9258 RepID=F7D748_ORNAN